MNDEIIRYIIELLKPAIKPTIGFFIFIFITSIVLTIIAALKKRK